MATSAYIRNRLISSASLTGTSAFVAAFPKRKDEDHYSHMKPFGCLCYAVVPEAKQKSFTSKTRPCLFLGYVWDSTKIFKIMDIATRYVFTSPSVKFDEYQFPGLPDKKPNPNLFPYRSCLPHMNPTIDKVEDLISPSNADENCGSVDLSTKSPPRKKSRTRKDVPEIPQSAEEVMESGPRTSLGAELDITYPQGDSPQGVELRTKRQHRQGVELPIRTNEGIPSPQGVELRTKRQRQNEKPNHRNATTKVPALRPGVNTVSADMHTDHPAWERTISMINLMSGLTYFDLVEDELFTSLTSREAGPSSFLRRSEERV